ncbi:hypothetical protein LSAT2_006414 [Lamellibrachia satsuma]|nr:hypothetical protein LSAT2_006414 [Lamellibrachia satsuma]
MSSGDYSWWLPSSVLLGLAGGSTETGRLVVFASEAFWLIDAFWCFVFCMLTSVVQAQQSYNKARLHDVTGKTCDRVKVNSIYRNGKRRHKLIRDSYQAPDPQSDVVTVNVETYATVHESCFKGQQLVMYDNSSTEHIDNSSRLHTSYDDTTLNTRTTLVTTTMTSGTSDFPLTVIISSFFVIATIICAALFYFIVRRKVVKLQAELQSALDGEHDDLRPRVRSPSMWTDTSQRGTHHNLIEMAQNERRKTIVANTLHEHKKASPASEKEGTEADSQIYQIDGGTNRPYN